MPDDAWQEYRPPFAPHVLGRYEPRVVEDGLPLPQRVTAVCEACGETWRTVCSSGQVREHISRFGRVHLHRDPLAGTRVPGVGGR